MEINNKIRQTIHWLTLVGLWACSGNLKNIETIDELPPIFPDYINVTIPINVAPLHFKLTNSCNCTEIVAYFENGLQTLKIKGRDQNISIGFSEWKQLVSKTKEGSIRIKIVARQGNEWIAYKPFRVFVSNDSIDSYIAYRLIEPGYETWNEMGIYQRCIETYQETTIASNKMTNYNCINCHSFCMQSPDKMLFHMRKDFGSTFLVDGKRIETLNTKTANTISPLVYPSWHPSGKFVAFSVNSTKQMFHTSSRNRTEVFDYKSDVVIYDIDRHEIFTSPLLFSKSSFETFPTFSPDGKTLYFCSADSVAIPDEFDKVKYNICSVAFDPLSRKFGEKVDTLFNAARIGKSTSFPRVSPDGNFLMFTLLDYGNFSIWHREADLYMIDLSSNKTTALNHLNSNETESYHSWSSNSRWVVFSSRRIDGLYTRPFIAHIDKKGKASKPFLLPVNNADYYQQLMKSYNIPEFITGKVTITPYQVSQKVRKNDKIDIRFKK
jgi:hypothetical protein